MRFLLLFGTVSLFSDMAHESASSLRGAYLSLLGASAAAIGFASGLGEMVGYSLRVVFGRIADKTRLYWPLTIVGYALDILAVPALALVGEHGWVAACALLIVQRMGKAVKKPAKDTLLSFAASGEGVGRAFGIQELLDQVGAFLGPVLLTLVLYTQHSGSTLHRYALCFALTAIPGAIALALLFITKHKFPHPDRFEPEDSSSAPFRLQSHFVLYIAGISLFAFGFVDYSLILMHISRKGETLSSPLLTGDSLPLLYAFAMLIDALTALLCGFLYDKRGVRVLAATTLVSAPFPLFIFGARSPWAVFLGVALWGVGMGAQESILKAAVGNFVPKRARATGYGIFECAFGVAWFLGSTLLGLLYDRNMLAMILVSMGAQVLAVPLYFLSTKKVK